MITAIASIAKRIGPAKLILGGLVLAVVAFFAVSYASLRAANYRLALDRENALAEADSARAVAGGWERRAVQAEIERSRLDRELERRPVVRVPGEATIDTIRVNAEAPVRVVEEDGDTIRHALFNFQMPAPPVAGRVAVWLPTPPEPGRMEAWVALAPIPFSMTVTCATRGNGSVRSAAVRIDGVPQGVQFRPSLGLVDPDVCSPAPRSVSLGLPGRAASSLLDGGVRGAAITAAICTSGAVDGCDLDAWLVGIGAGVLADFLVDLLP